MALLQYRVGVCQLRCPSAAVRSLAVFYVVAKSPNEDPRKAAIWKIGGMIASQTRWMMV
jgi:hypothetical protein